MNIFAFQELTGKKIFLVESPAFTWDIKKKEVVKDQQPNLGFGIISISSWSGTQGYMNPPPPSSNPNEINVQADQSYEIKGENTLEKFLDDFKGCPIVIYLNNGSIYHGDLTPQTCPHCGSIKQPTIPVHIRYYVDKSGLRKSKLKKITK